MKTLRFREAQGPLASEMQNWGWNADTPDSEACFLPHRVRLFWLASLHPPFPGPGGRVLLPVVKLRAILREIVSFSC